MKLFKKVLILLGFVFFVLAIFAGIFAQNTNAQTPTQALDPCLNPLSTSTEGTDVTIVPGIECIDDTTKTVELTFHDLSPDSSYILCTGATLCFDEDPLPDWVTNDMAFNGYFKPVSAKADSVNGDLKITVCGDGNHKVKIDGCGGNDDWFHSGNLYLFTIGVASENSYIPSKKGGFYVAYSYPEVTVQPSTGLTINSTINVNLSLPQIPRPGGGERNNYKIEVVGPEGYEEAECVTLTSGSQSKSFGNLKVGRYTINIREQVNEKSKCEGGFTYIKVTCDVTTVGKGGGSCTDPKLGIDPKGQEYKAFLRDLADLNKLGVGNPLPCGSGGVSSLTNPAGCHVVNTAIGPINVDSPQGFIETLFKFVLMLASFGGTIIIIYAGYVFMTSRGDKEKIAGARETLTGAIVGLLFIVLSIVILEIIGIDILKIPGFTR